MNKPNETELSKTKENNPINSLNTSYKKLTKQLCKENINIIIVFNPFKLTYIFSTEDNFHMC